MKKSDFKRSNTIKTVFGILFFFFILHTSVYSKEIIVCKNCQIKKIATSISIAKSHDTIIVKKGIYNEYDILIDKPISLIGEKATINANFLGGALNIYSDSVLISGFIINNIKSSYTKDISGIYAHKINFFVLENNEINNPFFAFLIEKSKNGIIRNNTINGNAKDEISSGNGIHIWKSENMEIYKNTISKMRDGIYLEFVENSNIYNNLSKNHTRYGLHFMFSDNNSYKNNTFKNNIAGVAVMFSKRITIRNNVFQDNLGRSSYGLLLKEIYDSNISNNLFRTNTIGINLEGTSRLSFQNNILKNNGWAIKINGGCSSNIFYNNDFLNNTFDISYFGAESGNIFNENYWSDYTGYDLNKDGIGDKPYRPVKLFSYLVNNVPEIIILHRSLFINLINFSEKTSPIFTPKNLQDINPSLTQINND